MFIIDRTKCLCCHNCALECPVQAIGYIGTSYMIDQERCIGCGHCAKVCNVEAAHSTEQAEVTETGETEELNADIVVLGAGAAGIVAAAKAADASGKKVILLEKAAKFGGSGWFAGFGVKYNSDPRNDPPMFAEAEHVLLERGVDPAVLKLAKETPAEFFDWFRRQDPRVDEFWTAFPMRFGGTKMDLDGRKLFNLKNKDRAIGPGRSTSVMETILVDNFSRLGVRLLTRHEALKLEKDADGRIRGVLAKKPGGLVHISCRAVISCTGGFTFNDEMLHKYAPQFFGEEGSEPTHRFGAPTNTGDVVRLGESIGAYLDRDNFFANVFGPVHHPFSFAVFSAGCQSEMIHVNLNGKRFVDESIFGGGAAYIVKQPGRIAWSILDSDTKAMLAERFSHGPDANLFDRFNEEFEEEAALDTPVKKADTLEELAKLCGIEPSALADTVAAYNEACRTGDDTEFHKRPDTLRPIVTAPFYAIFEKVACDGAFGGMLVNADAEVYGENKKGIILGLYAAGDNASGWALNSHEEGDHRLMATNECNWAIASGYRAGIRAAAYCG